MTNKAVLLKQRKDILKLWLFLFLLLYVQCRIVGRRLQMAFYKKKIKKSEDATDRVVSLQTHTHIGSCINLSKQKPRRRQLQWKT